MTTPRDEQDTQPRQMTCVRRLYVLEDEDGRTWLAVEEPRQEDENPAEGGAMSHRTTKPDDDGPESADGSAEGSSGGGAGGAMSHLVPGDAADVEEDGEDQVTIVVPPKPGMVPVRLQAYRVSPALLPTGAEPAAR